jgi:serine/threonine protein kinase
MMETDHDVKAIFCEVLELTSDRDRSAYLNQACGEDAVLRSRVEALLKAYGESSSFLEAPVGIPTVTVDPSPLTESPGTVIGPYKLLESIGEGGMGLVYMAEQQRPVRRKVALKIIKPGMDTRQVIARFEAERQTLALMDHPNIARVFDAGATESGRPYFVMELVRGIPITDYCDRDRLAIEDRLELFIRVCQAVQHAHQKGIIHRDLKPTNVLVTLIDGTAVPKVIDFGVAKAMGQSLTEKTVFTGFAQLIGTPLYMSPEQAEFSGADVDTRSDIYALGVLLYELLTGSTPFDQDTLRTVAYDEVRRIIREVEPPKPSTRISTLEATAATVSANRKSDPYTLGKLIRGELDWIVMKALEKDRNRRYETANGLAADLRRYLNYEPVEAGPPSALYRLRKYARRNRAVLATAALVALALVAGTVVSAWQAIRALRAEGLAETRLSQVTQERDRVTEERNRADLAVRVYRSLNRHDRLKNYDRSTEMEGRVMEGDLRVLGLGHPWTLQSIRSYFASARMDRSYWEEARKTLEPLLDRSRRELGPEDELTVALTGWVAHAHGLLGQTEKAIALVNALPETLEALPARDLLACILYMSNQRDAALVQLQRLEALLPRLVPADDTFSILIRTRQALVLRDLGRFAEARPLLEQTLAEALHLRKRFSKRDEGIEWPRGISEVLLRQWPGLAPGISPMSRPPASFTFDAPFRDTGPVADGRIDPGEYGPGVEAAFDDAANPGWMYTWYQSRSKRTDDLSIRVHTAYTRESLFFAFRVRDQFVDAGEEDAKIPWQNDSVEVYINADQVANDVMPLRMDLQLNSNREGFGLISDARGHQRTILTDFTNAEWKVGTSRTPDGYIVEFEIPLALIDTRDGPEYVPATSGSELRVNFGITDNDASVSNQTDYGIFWAEDPDLSPSLGGEDFWTVALRLLPKERARAGSAAKPE